MARLKDRFFERVEGTVKCHRQLLWNFFCAKKGDQDEEGDQEAQKK
jgi:hypothetical protein